MLYLVVISLALFFDHGAFASFTTMFYDNYLD